MWPCQTPYRNVDTPHQSLLTRVPVEDPVRGRIHQPETHDWEGQCAGCLYKNGFCFQELGNQLWYAFHSPCKNQNQAQRSTVYRNYIFPSLFLNFELHFFTSLGTLIFHDSSEIIQKISQLYLQISLNFLESNFIPYSLMFELCFLVCRSFFFEKTEVKQGLRNFMFSVVSEFRCGLNVSRCHLL